MARYSKIGVQIWGDDKFRRLSRSKPSGRELWFFLLANPFRTALPGLIPAGERAQAERLEWTLPAFRACWQQIEKEGMACADWSAPLIWIPNMPRWDPPNGPNVGKAWGRTLRQMPECLLRNQAEAIIDALLHGISDAIWKGFRDGIGNDVRISDSRLPPTDNRLPPPQPSPMPPGHRSEGVADGNGDLPPEFYREYQAKVKAAVVKHGHPLPRAVTAELEAWKSRWSEEHGVAASE